MVDVRFLAMILNKAERAWAYAMQLREAPGELTPKFARTFTFRILVCTRRHF